MTPNAFSGEPEMMVNNKGNAAPRMVPKYGMKFISAEIIPNMSAYLIPTIHKPTEFNTHRISTTIVTPPTYCVVTFEISSRILLVLA